MRRIFKKVFLKIFVEFFKLKSSLRIIYPCICLEIWHMYFAGNLKVSKRAFDELVISFCYNLSFLNYLGINRVGFAII